MAKDNPRLGDVWDFQADRAPTPDTLDAARAILRSTALPATLTTLAFSGFGRDRLRSCLAALEARGEIQLSKRGDAVFSIHTWKDSLTMPIRPGEDLADYEARLRAEWERSQQPRKTVAEMTEAEQAAALAELGRPSPAPVIAPFEGKHLNHLTPHQRAEAARQLGIAHLFPSFR